MKEQHLSPKGLGISVAILSGLWMLGISLLGLSGRALEAVSFMQSHHILYELTGLGIVLGILEALIAGYVLGYAAAWLYNRFA